MAKRDLAHICNSKEISFLSRSVFLGWDSVETVGPGVLQQYHKQRGEKEQIWNDSR